MPSETNPPSPESVEAEVEPADRDERRIVVLQRTFRRMVAGERRLSANAARKIGEALLSDSTAD